MIEVDIFIPLLYGYIEAQKKAINMKNYNFAEIFPHDARNSRSPPYATLPFPSALKTLVIRTKMPISCLPEDYVEKNASFWNMTCAGRSTPWQRDIH